MREQVQRRAEAALRLARLSLRTLADADARQPAAQVVGLLLRLCILPRLLHFYRGHLSPILLSVAQDFDAALREVAAEGENYNLATYLDAVKARALLGLKMKEFHCRYDLLLTPSLPITAFAAGTEVADPISQKRWPDWTPFSYPFNLTQQPAASMPCGLSSDGLPVGVQVVGPMHRDGLVLRACRAYESRCPISLPTV